MLNQNPENLTDLMWQTHMKTLMKRKKNLQIAQTIDEAINEWYSLHGLPVPDWKRKDPDWWIRYLENLGIDPRNP
tara:strand:+ start:484 stop:708 length:225 start_codon:yes stop_codon:yes gene_type:complete